MVIDFKVVCSFKVGAVEKCFSIGRKYFQTERCTDSVFEKLMNIKCNGHLF